MKVLTRSLAIAALLCAFFGSASAQTTAIIATKLNMAGSPISSGRVTLLPVDANGKAIEVVSGGALNGPQAFSCSIASGAISGSCSVPDACLATPANFLYTVQVTDTSLRNPTSGQSFAMTKIVGVCGSSWALDAYAPPATTTNVQPIQISSGTAVPTSACVAPSEYHRLGTSNTIYICNAGSWVLVTGSGGGTSYTFPTGVMAGANSTAAPTAATSLQMQAAIGSGVYDAAGAAAAAIAGSMSGNAATATALQNLPTHCATGSSPTGVDVAGNSVGCAPVGTTSGVWQRAGTTLVGNIGNQYSIQEPTPIYNSTGSPALWEEFATCGWTTAGLCYWTGIDPFNLTAQNAGNPVISGVYHGKVEKISGTYYYMGVAYGSSATSYVLYSSTTPASSWTLVHSGLIPALGGTSWDVSQKGNIDWWVDGTGTWQVLYEALGSDSIWRVGRATATTTGVPTAFTAYSGNPVISWGGFSGASWASGGMCGGPRSTAQISSNFYTWLQCDSLGGTGSTGDTPTDIYRWKSTDASQHVWSLDTSSPALPRTTADEGPSNTAGAPGQVGDISMVEVNSNVYAAFDATDTQSPVSGDAIHVKLAVAPMTLAQLVGTQEGNGGVLGLTLGGNPNLGTPPGYTPPSSYQEFDSFSGTSGTLITAHTSSSSHTWSDVTTLYADTLASAATLNGLGQLLATAGASTNGGDYINSVTPSSADYTVCGNFTPLTTNNAFALFGRAVSGAFTNYLLNYSSSGGTQLYWRHTGSATQIGSTDATILSLSTTYKMCLVMSGSAISVTRNGTTIISGTDANISAAGLAGLRLSGGSGVEVTNFSVQ